MAEKYDIEIKISENELKRMIDMYADRISKTLYSTPDLAREFILNTRRFGALLDILEKIYAK